jgi:hypothetical protein
LASTVPDTAPPQLAASRRWARAALRADRSPVPPPSRSEGVLLDGYVGAFARDDVARVIALARADLARPAPASSRSVEGRRIPARPARRSHRPAQRPSIRAPIGDSLREAASRAARCGAPQHLPTRAPTSHRGQRPAVCLGRHQRVDERGLERSRSGDAEASCSCRKLAGSILLGAVIAWSSLLKHCERSPKDHPVAALHLYAAPGTGPTAHHLGGRP